MTVATADPTRKSTMMRYARRVLPETMQRRAIAPKVMVRIGLY
jgi:hypothetical protein